MAIDPIFGSAATGIQRGLDGLQRDAHTIAQANTREAGVLEPDILNALVQLSLDRTQVEASAAVIRRADEALSSLLDT